MAEWFHDAGSAEKWLRASWSGGRTEGGVVVRGGGVVNAVGGAVQEWARGAWAGGWCGAC